MNTEETMENMLKAQNLESMFSVQTDPLVWGSQLQILKEELDGFKQDLEGPYFWDFSVKSTYFKIMNGPTIK